jgi:hypothetical protein
MESVFGQEIGEDGAHLFEAECNLAAFLLACVGNYGEMRRVNFEPGRLGSRSERDTKDHGDEAYAERDRQESRHGRRAKGFKEMLPRASCERSSGGSFAGKGKGPAMRGLILRVPKIQSTLANAEDRGIEPLWLLPAVQRLASVPSTHTGSVLRSIARQIGILMSTDSWEL